jgi:PHD/YefM family antitoxin component YafN of YafNO toxin-antitoxin module
MPQIIPIKDLKNTSEVSELAHSVDEPIYVTKNGYGDMVLMSMETFQGVSDALKMYQSLLTSEKQIAEGKTHDAKESLGKLRSKYGL